MNTKEVELKEIEIKVEENMEIRDGANAPEDIHLFSVEEVSNSLNVQINEKDIFASKGLDTEEVERRLSENGPNKLTPPKRTPFYILFLKELLGVFPVLLEVAGILAFISFALDGTVANLFLGIILWVVVIVSASFNLSQVYKSIKVLKGFDNMVPAQTVTIRGGSRNSTSAQNLVVGDIIIIKGGDKIPADIRLLYASNLKVDNSSLTGESEAQVRKAVTTEKNPLEAHNLLYMGTLCLEGEGVGVVYKTGNETFLGRTARLASAGPVELTRLQLEIKQFVKYVSVISIVVGIIVFSVSLGLKVYWLDSFIFGVGSIVAIVPEGLQLTVTLALTLTATRMKKKNVLVKRLSIIETLGSTSVICSDKTGTLTQNKMTVSYLVYDMLIHICEKLTTSSRFDPENSTCSLLVKGSGLCNRAVFSEEGTIIGDASETALLRFSSEQLDVTKLREANPKVAEIPFNSTNKWQLSIHDDGEKRTVWMKGAPERILSRCVSKDVDGEVKPLSNEDEVALKGLLEELATLGQRVLGFARFELDPEKYPKDFEYDTTDINFPMEGLTFVGLVGLYDPPREGVPEAISTCKAAGVKVVMVTGDYPVTALAIARKIGIVTGRTPQDVQAEESKLSLAEAKQKAEAIVVTGTDIPSLTDEDWDIITHKKEIVFARTSPEQKLQIVSRFQAIKEVVAVTGDGVNDSPALKKADVGVAMGVGGSEVAKEAADILLMDDNFPTIVNAIEEGRLVFDNLKKSIAYALSAKIPEVLPFLGFIILGMPLPLSTAMVLCIDIGTDVIPGISLAYEKAERDIMKRSPRNPKKHKLVNWKLLLFSLVEIGILQAASGFTAYFLTMGKYGITPSDTIGIARTYFKQGAPDLELHGQVFDAARQLAILAEAQTAFFTSIILTQIADCFIVKTRYLSFFQALPNSKNYLQMVGLVVAVLVGVCFTYIPVFNFVLGTAPVDGYHWLETLPFSVFIFCQDEIRKFVIRYYNKTGWTKYIYW